MTQANDSIAITPGSGATVAPHSVGAKEHQVVMVADDAGYLRGCTPTYVLVVPAQAVGSNKVFFDLFNATGSGVTLKVRSVRAIKDGSAAVTGTLSIKLHLTRTSSAGTGGTAATADGSSLTAATISKRDPSDAALPAGVTARLTPAGGAAAGAVLSERHIFPEETNASGYDHPEFVSSDAEDVQPVVIPQNTGIRVVQGAIASVGNVAFQVIFEAV